MQNELMNGAMTILTQAVLSVLGIVVTAATSILINYLKAKKEELILKMGADQYLHNYNVAKGIYFAVEQSFKGITCCAEEKRKLFDNLLTQKIPGLTQNDLDHFRESIVGEINTQIKQSGLLTTPETRSSSLPQPTTSDSANPISGQSTQ